MAEDNDFGQQKAKTGDVRSNAQDYLRLLIDREEKIETLRSTVHAQELAIQDLSSRNDEKDKIISEKDRTIGEKDKIIDEKDKVIASLNATNDRLRAELQEATESRKSQSNETHARIMPLVPYDTTDIGEPPSTPATTIEKPRRKAVRIDDEVVARLKNDRKAYPIVCDKALQYWTLLIEADLIDHRLKPTSRCGVTVMARIVSRLQTEVDPAISWAFFERYWKCDHLQSNLHREAYKHRKYYAIVNRIFGLPDDAPYLTKSSQAV